MQVKQLCSTREEFSPGESIIALLCLIPEKCHSSDYIQESVPPLSRSPRSETIMLC